MKENIINTYNKLIEQIVDKFATRFYKEMYWEEVDESYYDIMTYIWINQWPVEISDLYLNIDDIIVSEMYQIPSQIFIDYYDLCLDSYTEKSEWPWINLYNYWRKKTLDNELLEHERLNDLKASEESVKNAKQELEKLITKK